MAHKTEILKLKKCKSQVARARGGALARTTQLLGCLDSQRTGTAGDRPMIHSCKPTNEYCYKCSAKCAWELHVDATTSQLETMAGHVRTMRQLGRTPWHKVSIH